MQQDIKKLTNDCLDYFSISCYTQSSIDKYKSMWKHGILSYMREKNLTMYTANVGEDFVESLIGSESKKSIIRSVRVLTDFMNLGYVRKSAYVPTEHPLNGEVGCQMKKLIGHLQTLRRSTSTIKEYQLHMSRFLTFLKHEQVFAISGISERHVLKFVSTMENNKVGVVTCLRVLFRFWYETGVIDGNLHEVFDHYKWIRPEKIPSYYTADEVSVIEKSVERSSKVGKRNYAMLLLASRLGLRASDIAQLKFSNIDWERNEIRLMQHKTGNPVVLPLLSDVGNAIIDYLKHGRQKSQSQQVFLSAKAPYVSVTRGMVCVGIAHMIRRSKLPIQNRHHGPHSLRHSLASRLLENSVPIHVISEALGHTDTETTMSYMRIDIASLLKCALPVPSVSESFYIQKGGVFYE